MREFCRIHKQGLGRFSEQAVESAHFEFKQTWERYKRLPNTADFAEQLFKASVAFNSLHLGGQI